MALKLKKSSRVAASDKIFYTIVYTIITLIVLVLFPGMKPEHVSILTGIDCAALIIAFLDYAKMYATHGSMIQKLEKDEEE